jgi:hypothetical protein
MGYRDILVHLDDHRGYERRMQLAISIAQRDKAHLVGLYGFELPPAPAPAVVAEAYVAPNVSAGWDAYVRDRDAAFSNAAQFEAEFRNATSSATRASGRESRPAGRFVPTGPPTLSPSSSSSHAMPISRSWARPTPTIRCSTNWRDFPKR